MRLLDLEYLNYRGKNAEAMLTRMSITNAALAMFHIKCLIADQIVSDTSV